MSQLGIIASSITKPVATVDFKMEITTIGASESFSFPFFTGTYTNCTIDFGDGGGPKTISSSVDANRTNIYAVANTYTIIISADACGGIFFNGALPDLRVDEITQWGTIAFERMDFAGCSNMIVTATDIPDLSSLTVFINLFNGCSSIVTVPNLNSWDTSTITDMTNCFNAATLFNQDISGWDVSNVTNFTSMFDSANSFNTTLNGWTLDGGGNINMTNMFFANGAYNSSLSSWDMTKVTNTTGMFRSAFCIFNHSSINSWNVSNITNMTSMFEDNNTFNQPLNSWTPVACITMANMFENADAFNQDLSGWTPLTALTTVQDMFRDMANFNNGGATLTWNLPACATFISMFLNAIGFNQALSLTFKSSGTITLQNMLTNASNFDQDISAWNMVAVNNLISFLSGVTLSTANYDVLLTGWDAQALVASVTADFGGSTYTKTQVDSGTTDGTTANKLVDSTQTDFLTTVAVNDIVHNTTDDTYAKVTAVDSNTILSLNADIMISGETYQIETSAAVKAKENMINSDSWTIVDGGGV